MEMKWSNMIPSGVYSKARDLTFVIRGGRHLLIECLAKRGRRHLIEVPDGVTTIEEAITFVEDSVEEWSNKFNKQEEDK